ncbi:hypothetical protein Tco_0116838 [Tanacetum coccineum]
MLASQVVEGEGSGQPFEPQHIPTTASPSHVVLIPTVASSSHPKKTHKHRKTKRQTTEISESSGPTTLVADETVHGERGDGVERAATTAASLDAKQDSDTILGDKHAQTRFERLSKQSNDPPLSRVNTLRSGEDNMKLNGLIEICIRLSERVLALENIKTAHNFEIINLKKRVKKLEKKKKEDASKQGRNIIDQDEEISWFQEDPKTQGRYGHDFEVNTASTSITTASINITTAEPVTTANAPVTTVGVSVSTAEPSIMQELEKPVKVKKAKIKNCIDEDVVDVCCDEEDYEFSSETTSKRLRERLTIKEDQNVCRVMEKMKTHFAMLRAESRRNHQPKPKEESKMKAELQACLDIVLGDAVSIESLATKYPVVDWKTHILAEDKMYYQIIRADGIHLLLMDTGITIHMMVEKKYPLTQEMLSRMLSGKLEVDHECEMAYELLRFTKSRYKK